MSLKVSKEAAAWYKEEMDLNDGDYIQFYVKLYGGIPTVHPNYSLGVSVGKTDHIGISDTVDGITFFFDDDDAWFLDDFEMEIVKKGDEVDFLFHKKTKDS